MMVDENETLMDSLEIKENKIEVITTTVETEITTTHEEIVHEEKVVVTIEEEITSSSSSTNVEPIASPSWVYALGLHNLLDILKAPFNRKNKQK